MNNKRKNIGIFLGHPAHFYLYRNIITALQNQGKDVTIIIKQKDILETLVKKAGYKYFVIRGGRSNSLFGLIFSVFEMEIRIIKVLFKNKISVLSGTTLSFASYLMGVDVVITNEDDASIVPIYAKLSYPFAASILSPTFCSNGKWERKSIKYAGFQKLAYLHPNQFMADKRVVEQYFPTDKPYFLLRLSRLNAHHDGGATGISDETAQQLVKRLSPYGDVYITSERELIPQLQRYQLNINLLDIHHIMFYAKLYIGDSQSMAVEAAMLGVPSIRFNSFAGKIGVLEELETKYELTFSIPSDAPQRLFDLTDELLSNNNIKEVFRGRRDKMLNDKIDVTAFFSWFIANYPESEKIMRDNPDYQYRFK